jgi:glycosyltransferase involved in cell wall biosynthesis
MNVLILTSSNPNKIAGIIAKDLFESLKRNKDIEARLVVREYDKYEVKGVFSVNSKIDHFLIRVVNRLNIILSALRLIKERTIKTDPDYFILDYDQSKEYYKTRQLLSKANFKPDAIIILFMAKFLNFKNLYELNHLTGAPIYLYLMDMAAFTGGCHYAWACKGYFRNCGKCPGIFSNNPYDQTNVNWEFKKKYSSKINLEVVIGSAELGKQVLNSSLFKGMKVSQEVYIPVNEEIYKPEDKLIIRKQLGLPLNKKIIFFGSYLVTNRRKGFNELIKSLDILYSIITEECRNNIHLLIVGYMEDGVSKSIPFDFTSLGYLTHSDLPQAFQAANIFASPSIEDSGPMMVNQALMCGTPVVSFGVGVAIDFVRNGITGYRVNLYDCNEFAQGLKNLLQLDEERSKQVALNCREFAIKSFSIEVTCERWSRLLGVNKL